MMGKQKWYVGRQFLLIEQLAFSGLILLVWMEEILDIPHLFLGAEKTPINWKESFFETVVIAIVALYIIVFTKKLIKKMKILEGILPVCAACKRIRDQKGIWQPMEVYISDRSYADFSHDICSDCARKIYPELELDKG